jgi:leucyl/phenylalanyl-tRNA--protein transferase
MRRPRRAPLWLDQDAPPVFPDPRDYDRQGLVAFGGDLSPVRLLAAYRSGLFPWYGDGDVPMWWSPDPRALLSPATLHVSRSLRRTIRAGGFALGWNQCFGRVMRECGQRRPEGTWVIPDMILAYEQLHRLGHAHSLEVFAGDELAAGIYGVQVGALFAAESMFHRRTDMSKVALAALVGSVFAAGIRLFDVQFATKHLGSMGAVEVARTDYLDRLAEAVDLQVDLRGLVPRLPD